MGDKFENKDILEQQTRQRIYAKVKSVPGINTAVLSRHAELNITSTNYHIRMMTTTKDKPLITRIKEHGSVILFANDGTFHYREMQLIAKIHHSGTYEVLENIIYGPQLTRAEMSRELHKTGSSIGWHIDKLLEAGVIVENGRYFDPHSENIQVYLTAIDKLYKIRAANKETTTSTSPTHIKVGNE